MQRTMKLYRLPDVSENTHISQTQIWATKPCRAFMLLLLWVSLLQTPKTSGLRTMTKKDVPVVHRLLREYLSQFNLVPAMNQEEVEHWLLPRENIIDTYLVEVKKRNSRDFLPETSLNSSVLNHPAERLYINVSFS